jgi:hypothetical protein
MIPESIALSPKGLHISATESIIGSKQLGRAVSDLVPISKETLTSAQFDQFADVSPELEWLANITNPTRSMSRSLSGSPGCRLRLDCARSPARTS